MSTLLYDLKASRIMNKTFFVHHLRIYDNNMVLERRRLPFHKEETTIAYGHVSQVNLIKDLFFAHLEIINTGGVENILIRYVGKRAGKEAKNIIDAKIHRTHGVYTPHQSGRTSDFSTHSEQMLETRKIVDDKALTRYKDLLNQGRISRIEYNRLLGLRR